MTEQGYSITGEETAGYPTADMVTDWTPDDRPSEDGKSTGTPINHLQCNSRQHDSSAEGAEEQRQDSDGQLLCNHCGRPTFYCYADEAYHHAERPEIGCFLILPEPA